MVLSGLLDHWLDRLPPERVHYVQLTSAPPPPEPPPFVHHRVTGPSSVEKVRSLAWHAVLRRDKTIQESLLYSPSTARRLAEVLASVDADLEMYDTVRLAQYAERTRRAGGGRQVAYLDDLFSVRYARMRDALVAHPDVEMNVLGEFGPHVPAPMRWAVGRPAVQRSVLRYEGRLMARSEDRAAAALPSLLINAEETRLLAARSPSARVSTMPPLLAPPTIRHTRAYDGRPEFVFLGLLTLPHNAVAVRSFLQRQMPGVLRELPQARLRIVGRGADHDLRSAAARFGDRVTFEGFVPDLDALLTQACALVNPLLFGTGIKLKVLEALARGLPVLSTATGCEGIASGREQGCVIDDRLDTYPALMRELIDPALNDRLSRSAREHYDRTFAPAAVHARYDQIFAGPSR